MADQAKTSEPRESELPSPLRKRSLATLRHELRTPVNHIIGFSEILIEDAPARVPERFLGDLQHIHDGGKQLLALVNHHLDDSVFPEASRDLHLLCHELRTPVNHIIGYSELLIDECAESGWADFQADLGKINQAARTWLRLMETCLIAETGSPDEPGAPAPPDQDAAPAFKPPAEALRQPRQDTPRLPGEAAHLLLADDDEANRELLQRWLERLGARVTTCANGQEALDLASARSFDLILLDLLMPGLDGREVLARLKASPALRHLPVIMVSALDELEGVIRCIELGAEDFVAKPFNPVFLRARIGAALEKKRFRDREVSYLQEIQQEKHRSEELLHIILPQDVADELKATQAVQPRRFESVGVLFCDLVGFTAYCDRHPPEEILAQLQQLVENFEGLAAAHGLEKIKTIGDAFMATAGLRAAVPNPAWSCVRCARDMIAAAARLSPPWQVRVGIQVGPVVAGVVGQRKYQYDIWGDTVNLAARMAEAAEPGSIFMPAEAWSSVVGKCRGTAIGQVEVKGKGRLEIFRIEPELP